MTLLPVQSQFGATPETCRPLRNASEPFAGTRRSFPRRSHRLVGLLWDCAELSAESQNPPHVLRTIRTRDPRIVLNLLQAPLTHSQMRAEQEEDLVAQSRPTPSPSSQTAK